MKKSRWTEERNRAVAGGHVVGSDVSKLWRRCGVAEREMANWRMRHERNGMSAVRIPHASEEGNAALKRLLAQVMVEDSDHRGLRSRNS